MPPVITAFAQSPDKGRGLARDMRVRWALEEVNQPYTVRLVTFAEMKEAPHLARQPFGQIPTFEDGELVLFESAAIVLHLAQSFPGLLPVDANARSRAISWMFNAQNTIEPTILELENTRFFERDQSWYEARLPLVEGRIQNRLNALSQRLGEAEWLDGAFSAGDLVMVGVLMRIRSSSLLSPYPHLESYLARAEARPAFQRAFAAQLAVYKALSGSG